MFAPSSSSSDDSNNGDRVVDEVCLLSRKCQDTSFTVKFSIDGIKERFSELKSTSLMSHEFKINDETFQISAKIHQRLPFTEATEVWYLGVSLLKTDGSSDCVVSFTLDVLDTDLKIAFRKRTMKRNMGWQEVLCRTAIDALPNNIHLLCSVTLHGKENDILSTKRSRSITNLIMEDKLVSYKKMKVGLPSAKEKLFTDFNIESEDGLVINCHRNFLASHSPVFKAMLESDMTESKERRLKLDFTGECLQQVVDFLYDTTLDEEIVLKHYEDFLQLADKYNIDHMKLQTEDILIKNLSTDLMVNFYCLGDLFNAQNLKEAARTFMANNKECFKDKEFTKQLQKFDPARIVEIMNIVV